MRGLEFCKEGGSYQVYLDGDLFYEADEIAIAVDFDPEYKTSVAHKHGSEKDVSQWISKTREAFRSKGFNDYADRLIMISSDNWDLETLNRIWNCTGSINQFLKESGITTEDLNHCGEAVPGFQGVPLI